MTLHCESKKQNTTLIITSANVILVIAHRSSFVGGGGVSKHVRWSRCYYRPLIGSDIWPIKKRQFWRAWVIHLVQAFLNGVFTARRYAMLARYMLSLCVRLSVCLSVTSRHCTKTTKRRICKQRHAIAKGLYRFLTPNISAKFRRSHAQRGRQIEVGLCSNRWFSTNISLNLKKRCKIGT